MAYFLATDAIQDMDELWDYLVQNAGTTIADKVIKSFYGDFQLLSNHPKIGKACDQLGVGLRSLVTGNNHIIFYRIHNADIKVLHVVNGRRDLGTILKHKLQ